MKSKTYHTKSGKPIRLWQGDCMELMGGKPENYWDLAICDPPYGIDAGNMTMGRGSGNDLGRNKLGNWDKNIPNEDYFFTLKTVSTNQIIWGGELLSAVLRKIKRPYYME